ncbi:MAG: hypothetical protein WCG14_08165 [Chlamydiia bacterium]
MISDHFYFISIFSIAALPTTYIISHLIRQCLDQRLSEKATLDEEVRAWTKEGKEKKIMANWQCREVDARVK